MTATRSDTADSGARADALSLTLPSDREILMTRTFDAPRRLVFEAMTRPEHVRRWYGCDGAELTVCEIDLRPGGLWRYVLRMPDGQEFPFAGMYREIAAPERLVYTERFDVEPYAKHEAIVTATLEERHGRTTLTCRILHDSRESRDGQLGAGMEQGAAQTYDRLAAHMGELQGRSIILSRRFAAPRELVWKAWTDPKHVGQWWGPRGFTTTTHEMDVRPGGIWRHTMHGPDGRDYPNRTEYLEVVEPERIVYRNGDDAPDASPNEGFVVTATFDADGRDTLLTMQMVFPSAAARDYVAREFGAVEGGEQTLERLAEHLATLRG